MASSIEPIGAVATADGAGGASGGLDRGWPDWLLDRIHAAPGPALAAYVTTYAVLAVVAHAAHWLGGTSTPGTLDALALVEASFPVVFLATLDVLNGVALRSLRTLRPALTIVEAATARLARDLVRTPRAWSGVAAAAGVAFTVLSIADSPGNYGLRADSRPALWAWELASGIAASAVAMALVVHAIHQVRIVMRVHRESVRIDVFRLDPLYGFASLTSWTGIALVGIVACGYGALTLAGSLTLAPTDLALIGGIAVVAVAIFVVPLLGLHDQILAEKERRRAEAGEALELAVRAVHAAIRAGDVSQMDHLNNGVNAATSIMATISRTSAWPWRPDTLRGFVSAIGLPVLLWVITATLGKVL